MASRAFETYPNAECAREWADVLLMLGRTDDAMQRLADAFAIPDMRALEIGPSKRQAEVGRVVRQEERVGKRPGRLYSGGLRPDFEPGGTAPEEDPGAGPELGGAESSGVHHHGARRKEAAAQDA